MIDKDLITEIRLDRSGSNINGDGWGGGDGNIYGGNWFVADCDVLMETDSPPPESSIMLNGQDGYGFPLNHF